MLSEATELTPIVYSNKWGRIGRGILGTIVLLLAAWALHAFQHSAKHRRLRGSSSKQTKIPLLHSNPTVKTNKWKALSIQGLETLRIKTAALNALKPIKCIDGGADMLMSIQRTIKPYYTAECIDGTIMFKHQEI